MMRVEHEYERRGALQYLAAYDVHHARVIGRGRIVPTTGIERPPAGRAGHAHEPEAPPTGTRILVGQAEILSVRQGEVAASPPASEVEDAPRCLAEDVAPTLVGNSWQLEHPSG